MKMLRNMNRRNLCIAAAISLVAIVLVAETNQMKGDTMKTQQKAIVIALIGTLAVSSLTAVPAFAATSEPPSREAEVYVLEEEEAGTTTLRERGRCTDSYSKEWCDSHGFQNNRPVPHKVPLNKKEEDCLRKFFISETGQLLKAGIGPSGKSFIGLAQPVFELFLCLR